MVLAKRKMSLSKKVIEEKIQSYAQVVQKARMNSKYKREFEKIGREMKSEIKERDNRNLVQAGKDIKGYARKFSRIFGGKRKAIEAPKEEKIPEKNAVRNFEDDRAEFLKRNEAGEQVHENQYKEPKSRIEGQRKKEDKPNTGDGRYE